MRFCEQLNEYITRLNCRGKELADGARLSAPTLSRYRTGERTLSFLGGGRARPSFAKCL